MISTEPTLSARPSWSGHLEICRLDHWTKNVLAVPGLVVALSIAPERLELGLLVRTVMGFFALGLVASSNYVLNELLDASFDAQHPTKVARPVPSGRVHRPLAWVQWLSLALAGWGLGLWISTPFALLLVVFWLMGCVYNARPFRLKDVPYLDVLSEGANNPIRMLAGWLIVGPDATAPGSLLVSYWMIGCYFMAMKRFAEYRHIGDAQRAAAYRPSFARYDESGLLIAVMFYAAASMLMLGAFIVRYRLTLILSFPFVALVMAIYLKLGLQPDSPTQEPESLYRQRSLMIAIVLCAVVMTVCLFVDMPILARIFAPSPLPD